MPPCKEPIPLRDLTLKKVAELSEKTCLKICERHNTYGSQQQRYDEAAELRDHLVRYIRPVLDEVCCYVFTMSKKDTLGLAGDVFLSAFMNEQMKTLTCRGSALLYNYFAINTPFWKKQLVNVPNLVEFDLENVDHIPEQTFKILAEQCPYLEVIKFKFQATTIQGIGHLKMIKNVRIIKDTGKGNLFNVERSLLCMLLKELPKLEYINSCSCMGDILGCLTNIPSLGLMKAWESKTLSGVENIVNLCPKLTSLTLGKHNHSSDHDLSSMVKPVTNSCLQLMSLKLRSLNFTNYIEDLFRNKGALIKSLTLHFVLQTDNTPHSLNVIGKYCPLLEEFKIYNFEIDTEIYEFRKYEALVPIFEKLVKFTCNFSSPLPIQICLAHAHSIKSISVSCQLWNIGHGETGNLLTLELISRNKLAELQSLFIDFSSSEFVLSQGLIEHIFYSLPQLIKLDLLNMVHTPDLRACLQKLTDEILLRNLDIDFNYSFEDS